MKSITITSCVISCEETKVEFMSGLLVCMLACGVHDTLKKPKTLPWFPPERKGKVEFSNS